MQVTNEQLSKRELEILRLVATGASNKEIAKELYISTNTVKVHLRNIFAKIGVNSRTEAAMYAVNTGIIPGAKPAGEAELSTSTDETERKSRLRSFAAWSAVVIVVILGFAGLLTVIRNQAPETGSNNPPLPTALQRWEVKASMPTARYGFATTAYENQIYAIGGETEEGVVGIAERYDPGSDSWEKLSDKPLAVGDVSGAVIGGKIYIPGGRLPSGDLTDTLEIYNPREDRWEMGKRLPVPLSAYALTAFEGRLYLFGGWDGEKYREFVYEFDPVVDEWKEKTPMHTARGYSGAGVSGNSIFVFGGINESGLLDVNEAYLPSQDTGDGKAWANLSTLPGERYAMGVTSVADIFYLFGGSDNSVSPIYALEYQPQTDTWREFENTVDKPLLQPGTVTLGTQIYILGGQLDESVIDHNMAYKAIYTVVLPITR